MWTLSAVGKAVLYPGRSRSGVKGIRDQKAYYMLEPRYLQSRGITKINHAATLNNVAFNYITMTPGEQYVVFRSRIRFTFHGPDRPPPQCASVYRM